MGNSLQAMQDNTGPMRMCILFISIQSENKYHTENSRLQVFLKKELGYIVSRWFCENGKDDFL